MMKVYQRTLKTLVFPSFYRIFLLLDKISKQDLIQLQNNIKIKPSIILSNSNLNLPKEGMDKYDNKHRELNKKFNNPIELTD